MNWLNLETKTLHSPEFIGSKPAARATWLAVSLWCAVQENGGRIIGARQWKCRQWQQTCGVMLKEIESATPLLSWDGDDLLIWNYPVSREAEVQARREAGREGGKRSGEVRQRSTASSKTEAEPQAGLERKGKGKEEEGKEGEGSPSLAQFSKLVLGIKNDIPDHFIRSKYFGALTKFHGVIQNPAFFAGQVVGWYDEKRPPTQRKADPKKLTDLQKALITSGMSEEEARRQ